MARPYLTRSLLQARVGGEVIYLGLTDDDVDAQPDASVERYLLRQVDAVGDSYFRRGGYTTPLASIDVEFVVPYLLDIANYRAKSRGNRVPDEDDRLAYENALKALEMIATGELTLPSFGDAAPSTSSMILDSPQPGPFFNRATLRQF